jgi:hypothetical protein
MQMRNIAYVREFQVAPILNAMVNHLLLTAPEDPVTSLIDMLEAWNDDLVSKASKQGGRPVDYISGKLEPLPPGKLRAAASKRNSAASSSAASSVKSSPVTAASDAPKPADQTKTLPKRTDPAAAARGASSQLAGSVVLRALMSADAASVPLATAARHPILAFIGSGKVKTTTSASLSRPQQPTQSTHIVHSKSAAPGAASAVQNKPPGSTPSVLLSSLAREGGSRLALDRRQPLLFAVATLSTSQREHDTDAIVVKSQPPAKSRTDAPTTSGSDSHQPSSSSSTASAVTAASQQPSKAAEAAPQPSPPSTAAHSRGDVSIARVAALFHLPLLALVAGLERSAPSKISAAPKAANHQPTRPAAPSASSHSLVLALARSLGEHDGEGGTPAANAAARFPHLRFIASLKS